VIGVLAPGDLGSPELGLISYGWFEEAIYVINALPYEIPSSGISIEGCDATGRTMVEIDGVTYYLEAWGSWSGQSVQDEGTGCYKTYTVALTNAGFISRSRFRSDISAHDDNVQLELPKRYFHIEEDISFSVRIIGEQGIDFSGFCMFTFEGHEGTAWEPVGDCSALPDYVPEPFPRQQGETIQVLLPTKTLGLQYAYQYELSPGTYRLKFTYAYPGGMGELFSPHFYIQDPSR
jgi:hypothetical protein